MYWRGTDRLTVRMAGIILQQISLSNQYVMKLHTVQTHTVLYVSYPSTKLEGGWERVFCHSLRPSTVCSSLSHPLGKLSLTIRPSTRYTCLEPWHLKDHAVTQDMMLEDIKIFLGMQNSGVLFIKTAPPCPLPQHALTPWGGVKQSDEECDRHGPGLRGPPEPPLHPSRGSPPRWPLASHSCS